MTITSIGGAISTLPNTVPAESTALISPGPVGPQGAQGPQGLTGLSGLATPGGRLTLSSNVPVMTTSVTAASAIYYTPFVHNNIPIYNGSALVLLPFSQTSVALDTANVISGNIYDLFLWNNAGTPTLGYGPAWTSHTVRSAAITQTTGIWSNSASITLRMSSISTQSVAANQATYVGSFYATANGQTGMAFLSSGAGGGGGILALFNAYNQCLIHAREMDTTSGWSYGSTTWRMADGNAKNSISFVDGLGIVGVQATYLCQIHADPGDGSEPTIGINMNSTSAPAYCSIGENNNANSNYYSNSITDIFLPVLGYNAVNALERAAFSATCDFTGSGGDPGQVQGLTISVMM